MMKTANTLNWLVAIVGLWVLLSPFVLGFSTLTVAVSNAVITGLVLIVLAGWAALAKVATLDRNLDWVNAVAGLWLIISPFVLGFSTTPVAMWNNVITGIVAIVLAGWAAFTFGRLVSPQS